MAMLDKASRFCHTVYVFNLHPEDQMAVSAHLVELTEKHRLLERRIREELARPSSDAVALAKLKLEKLKIKDAISKLDQTRH